MSRIRADKFVNSGATGAPQLTFGAEVPVGYGITGAGGINIAGVATATSLSIDDKIIHTGDTNTAIRFPAADTFTVETAGSERTRVDSSGRLLLGTSTSRSIGAGAGYPGKLQVESSGFTNTTFTQNSNDLYGPEINLGKSRGAAAGGTTVVQSGDQLGIIQFAGADGTDLETNAAAIECRVDGTPGSNDMPGRLLFYTTADGAASPTERLRIDSSGKVGININNPGSYNSAGNELVLGNTGNNGGMTIVSGTGNNGHIFFADGTGAPNQGIIKYEHANDAMAFNTNTGERLRILSGGGLTFNGDSATANALDDYEEGTFTPTIQNFSTTGTNTLTGRYVKVGRQVTIGIQWNCTGTITHGVSALISLPFGPTSSTGANGLIGMLVNSNSSAFNSNKTGVQCKIDTEGGARFFPGSFTATSTGEGLLFGGTYISAT